MEIILLAPHTLPVPPNHGFGGRQRGIYDFVKYFGARGHAVHLIAPGDSDVRGLPGATFHPTIEFATQGPNAARNAHPRDARARHMLLAVEIVRDLIATGRIDAVSNRTSNDYNQHLEQAGVRLPVAFHISETNVDPDGFRAAFNALGDNFYPVTHGPSHMAQYPGVNRITNVLYGIDVSMYDPSPYVLTEAPEEPALAVQKAIRGGGRNYYLTIGRISPAKGQRTAIDLVLEETDDHLIIAGTPQPYVLAQFERQRSSVEYLERDIAPFCSTERGRGRIHYFGNADEAQKRELLRYAAGFIFPTGFEFPAFKEPFARAPLEALASGVPVLGFNYASVPEMIEDGVNGVLFDDMGGARAGLRRLANISRAACRASVERRFHAGRVARDYEALLRRIIAEVGARSR